MYVQPKYAEEFIRKNRQNEKYIALQKSCVKETAFMLIDELLKFKTLTLPQELALQNLQEVLTFVQRIAREKGAAATYEFMKAYFPAAQSLEGQGFLVKCAQNVYLQHLCNSLYQPSTSAGFLKKLVQKINFVYGFKVEPSQQDLLSLEKALLGEQMKVGGAEVLAVLQKVAGALAPNYRSRFIKKFSKEFERQAEQYRGIVIKTQEFYTYEERCKVELSRVVREVAQVFKVELSGVELLAEIKGKLDTQFQVIQSSQVREKIQQLTAASKDIGYYIYLLKRERLRFILQQFKLQHIVKDKNIDQVLGNLLAQGESELQNFRRFMSDLQYEGIIESLIRCKIIPQTTLAHRILAQIQYTKQLDELLQAMGVNLTHFARVVEAVLMKNMRMEDLLDKNNFPPEIARHLPQKTLEEIVRELKKIDLVAQMKQQQQVIQRAQQQQAEQKKVSLHQQITQILTQQYRASEASAQKIIEGLLAAGGFSNVPALEKINADWQFWDEFEQALATHADLMNYITAASAGHACSGLLSQTARAQQILSEYKKEHPQSQAAVSAQDLINKGMGQFRGEEQAFTRWVQASPARVAQMLYVLPEVWVDDAERVLVFGCMNTIVDIMQDAHDAQLAAAAKQMTLARTWVLSRALVKQGLDAFWGRDGKWADLLPERKQLPVALCFSAEGALVKFLAQRGVACMAEESALRLLVFAKARKALSPAEAEGLYRGDISRLCALIWPPS